MVRSRVSRCARDPSSRGAVMHLTFRAVAVCVCVVVASVGLHGPRAQGQGAEDARALPPAPATARQPTLDDPAVTSAAADYRISVEEARLRITWQDVAVDLDLVLGALLGGSYGGAWIDPDDGGRIKVGVAEGGDQRVRDAVPHELDPAVDLVAVDHTITFLESVQARLGDRAHEVSVGHPWGVAVGIAPDRNRVWLLVPPLEQQSPAIAVFIADAQVEFGQYLYLEEMTEPSSADACTPNAARPYCDSPLRGGVSIDYATSSGTSRCTAGLPARARSDGRLYLLTAGHCLRDRPNAWTTQSSGGATRLLGSPHRCFAGRGAASSCLQGDGDMGLIRVGSGTTIRGWVFVRPSPTNNGIQGTTRDSRYPIVRDGSAGLPLSGFRLCRSGIVSTSCGELVAVNVRHTSPDTGHEYRGMGAANYVRARGDSGGPVYAGGTIYGLHSGSTGGFGLYQGIRAAQDALNVDVVRN